MHKWKTPAIFIVGDRGRSCVPQPTPHEIDADEEIIEEEEEDEGVNVRAWMEGCTANRIEAASDHNKLRPPPHMRSLSLSHFLLRPARPSTVQSFKTTALDIPWRGWARLRTA